VLAIKSVSQNYSPPSELQNMLELFRRMVNHCLNIGIAHNVASLKKLSLLCYHELEQYRCYSSYKICAISRSAGILAARRKSLKRGYPSRNPYALKPYLTCCYGFKIEGNLLRIPRGNKAYWKIHLVPHTLTVVSEPTTRVRSFTITASKLSLCVSREVPEIECNDTMGIDRNLHNLTSGNQHRVVQYDISDTVRIAETTARIVRSFRRNDWRILEKIGAKYGRRRRNRIQQLIHNVTKRIVCEALEHRQALVLENIEGIRRLYRRGNGQGQRYRRKMNGWRFGEAQRQIEYKARWAGLPFIRLSRKETRGTSVTCPQCGERRRLWCRQCSALMDRDVVAVINLSQRGRLRFDRSRAQYGLEGGAVEAMRGNPTPTVILRVDASKSAIS